MYRQDDGIDQSLRRLGADRTYCNVLSQKKSSRLRSSAEKRKRVQKWLQTDVGRESWRKYVIFCIAWANAYMFSPRGNTHYCQMNVFFWSRTEKIHMLGLALFKLWWMRWGGILMLSTCILSRADRVIISIVYRIVIFPQISIILRIRLESECWMEWTVVQLEQPHCVLVKLMIMTVIMWRYRWQKVLTCHLAIFSIDPTCILQLSSSAPLSFCVY